MVKWSFKLVGRVEAETREEAYKKAREYLKNIAKSKNLPGYIDMWDEV